LIPTKPTNPLTLLLRIKSRQDNNTRIRAVGIKPSSLEVATTLPITSRGFDLISNVRNSEHYRNGVAVTITNVFRAVTDKGNGRGWNHWEMIFVWGWGMVVWV